MKLNAFAKGLIMALIGFVATTISNLDIINFKYILISSIGFTLVYVAKNYKFPSKSSLIGIDIQDFLSGLFLAIGMAVSSTVAQILTSGFEWNTLWIAVSGSFLGYLGKTFMSKPKE